MKPPPGILKIVQFLYIYNSQALEHVNWMWSGVWGRQGGVRLWLCGWMEVMVAMLVDRWIHLGWTEIDLMFGGSTNLERPRILWWIPFGHDSDFMPTYLCHEWWNRVISLVISSVWHLHYSPQVEGMHTTTQMWKRGCHSSLHLTFA